MPSEIRKAPSRIKYEDANPVVSFRVSREVKAKLNKVRYEHDVSFCDLVLEGAKLRELVRKKELGSINMGICRKCGKPMIFNLSNENHIKIIKKAINLAGVTHESCNN
jgi:hypothetical protein